MNTLFNIATVFIGSGIGGVCRWGLSLWLNSAHPYGTFAANVIGCFIIGLLSRMMPMNDTARLLLTVGFCGGFTTFSTFVNENLLMLRGGQFVSALCYITVSIAAGLLAAWAGYNIRIR